MQRNRNAARKTNQFDKLPGCVSICVMNVDDSHTLIDVVAIKTVTASTIVTLHIDLRIIYNCFLIRFWKFHDIFKFQTRVMSCTLQKTHFVAWPPDHVDSTNNTEFR